MLLAKRKKVQNNTQFFTFCKIYIKKNIRLVAQRASGWLSDGLIIQSHILMPY